MIWAGALLAMAVSIDSLGVGSAYAMRRIKIPFSSLLIIGLLSGTFVTVSMVAGSLLSAKLSADAAGVIGGAILVAIGCWQLLRGLRDYVAVQSGDETLWTVNIKPLGIIITVLRDPVAADVDRSGKIDVKESALLGTALGMDAFGVGLGASLAGFGYELIPLVTICCMLFVFVGQIVGGHYLVDWFGSLGFVVPGFVLIGLGMLEIL